MLVRITFTFLLSTCFHFGWTQKLDNQLTKLLRKEIALFNGDIGIYIKNLKTGKIVAIQADTVFPTASIVKIPILVGVMQAINEGTLSYHQKMIYKDSLLYPGEDILGSFKNNEAIDLSKIIMLMLTTSDNTASLWLQSLAGTGTRINVLMDSLGFSKTKVNSRTPGREQRRTKYGWGETTPRDIGSLIENIVYGRVINEKISAQMLKLLSRNYWDEEGLSAIPAGIFVASKNGAVDASRSEVMYVNSRTPYILAIFTKNNQDKSWEKSNEAWELIRKISNLVWQYYNQKKK